MERNRPSLEGRAITRTFGHGDTAVTAVDDVSLRLHLGEVTLLQGPSGSGKSTLLAILSGLLPPDRGEVIVAADLFADRSAPVGARSPDRAPRPDRRSPRSAKEDLWSHPGQGPETLSQPGSAGAGLPADGSAGARNLWEMSELEREQFRLQHCGFVFQEFNLFPSLKAREQLEIILNWGQEVPLRQARRRAEQTLSLLGLGKKLSLRPDELSGGEKQRVALGRALVKKPSLLFADEPTSSLGWDHGEQVVKLLRDSAREQQATVLIVAHDRRIMQYADQVLQLEDGRLQEEPAASTREG